MSTIFPSIMGKSTADPSSWSFGVSPPGLQGKGQFPLESRYFSDKRGEIDFVVQHGTEIIPIEVKGGEDI